MHTAKQYSNWFHYNEIISASSLLQDTPEELCDILNDVDPNYIHDIYLSTYLWLYSPFAGPWPHF
jgi:hypothetical protein